MDDYVDIVGDPPEINCDFLVLVGVYVDRFM